MAVQTQIQMRRGTASSWTSTNPTLAAGEIGFESDTGKFKIGTGSSTWNALPYTSSATAVTYVYTATAGQTTFSGADGNGNTLAYTAGAEQVYLNGTLLVRGTDYTASNGTSVVLTAAALVNDILTVVAFASFSVSSTIANSTLTAKGSLITATAASTPANLSVGADGYTLVADSAQSTGLGWSGNLSAGKNYVINGGMDIWQRGTSFTIPNGTTTYTADRWAVLRNATGMTVTRQSSGLTGSQYCLRVQRDSGNTSTTDLNFGYSLETADALQFAGKTITVSFYARVGANYSPTSAAFVSYVNWGTGTDQRILSGYTGSTNIIYTSSTLTTNWQRITATGTVSASATEFGLGFTMTPTGTAGASDYVEITNVQIELGSSATTFSRAGGTIQGELALAQRYYWRVTNDGNTNPIGFGYAYSTTAVNGFVNMPVTMRVRPTSLDYTNLSAIDGVTVYASTATVIGSSTPNMVRLDLTGLTGLTQYRPYSIQLAAASNQFFGLNAEL